MSNPEQHPTETVCAARPPADAHERPNIEIVEPRDVPLGGLRAMNVRRTLPQRARSMIGAWCFLDHYGPDDVATTGGMNVPAHPHTGLQTASWLFSGEIEHRDSAGFHALVKPGELNLMTAGRGISHSERSTPETTVLHGAQLWIALPTGARDGAKGFEHYAPPVISGDAQGAWRAQVFLGSLLGSTSPVPAHTPLVGAEIGLEAGAELVVPLDPAYEYGVLLDSGGVALTGASGSVEHEVVLAKDHLAYLPPGAEELRLTASDAGARLLLLGGEPFPEQIVMWWNFIGRDHDEIVQARADWHAQIASVGVGYVAASAASAATSTSTETAPGPVVEADPTRFGLPDGEPEPPLPAPPVPIAKLMPRRR